jgi:hypothetical protein
MLFSDYLSDCHTLHSGLNTLLSATHFDAIHDSAARERLRALTPKTTRTDFINTFIFWALQRDSSTSSPPLALVDGPKSDLALLCAERVERHLAATYFLTDLDHDDSTRFFGTIAYQLAMNFSIYAEILEDVLGQNPGILTKSLKVQFRELISVPFSGLVARNAKLGTKRLIIVDGFDGYERSVRREILRVVTEAVQAGTPFRWAFYSHERETDVDNALGLLEDEDLWWQVNLYEVELAGTPTSLALDIMSVVRNRLESRCSKARNLFVRLFTLIRLWLRMGLIH